MVNFFFSFSRKFLYANSVGPEQTPRFAASDLCLHFLPRSEK